MILLVLPTKTKVPQNKVVLQMYSFLRKEYPRDKQYVLVNILYTELTGVWKPASIFTDYEDYCKCLTIQKYEYLLYPAVNGTFDLKL